MLISQTAEYALRAMVYLASGDPDEPVPSKELAAAANIPPHYISKLLRPMVEHGLLESRKGHHGGYFLAQPPGMIRFYDVLVAAGMTPDLKHCAFGLERCNNDAPCPLHEAWSEVNDSFWSWAVENTLRKTAPDAAPPPQPVGNGT